MTHFVTKRLRTEESGVAMIIAIVLSSVIMTLAVMTLTVAEHADKASARGRHWVQALHVGESGVEDAVAKIQETNGAFTGTMTGTTEEGDYSVSVTRAANRVFTITATGAVREGRELAATRKLEVTMAPPSSFRYALFSYTSLATKNGDIIDGDIWANQNMSLDANTEIYGSVTAATGYVDANKNGVVVDGDIISGGFNPANQRAVHIGQNMTVGGNVTAAVVNPPDPISCGGQDPANYEVFLENGAIVQGVSTSWGQTVGGAVNGGRETACVSAPATKPMPTYTYSAANYDDEVEYGSPGAPSATAVADFQNYLSGLAGGELEGTFYINQDSPSSATQINLGGITFVGDTNIISNTPIFSDGAQDNDVDKLVLISSTYQPPAGSTCDVNTDSPGCTIQLKNNFTTSAATATLIYSPFGPVAIKNNAVHNGTVYADAIEIKNNQELTYDERVERIIGFGDVTLEVIKWLELNP